PVLEEGFAVTPQGDVYLAGSFGLLKYNAGGQRVWSVEGDFARPSPFASLWVDRFGSNILVNSAAGTSKYDKDGQLLWSLNPGFTNVSPRGLAFDDQGNFVVVQFLNSPFADTNVFDMVRKFDPLGNPLWQTTFDYQANYGSIELVRTDRA